MRNRLLSYIFAVFAAIALVIGAGVAQAQAVGGGCRLSANWWVTTSANWNGTQHTYAVITSPGALKLGASDTRSSAFNNNNFVDSAVFYRVGTGTNPYTYRADMYKSPVDEVEVKAEAPSGIYCLALHFH